MDNYTEYMSKEPINHLQRKQKIKKYTRGAGDVALVENHMLYFHKVLDSNSGTQVPRHINDSTI